MRQYFNYLKGKWIDGYKPKGLEFSNLMDQLNDMDNVEKNNYEMLQAVLQGEFDEAALQADFENKLEAAEATYAPRLTDLENDVVEINGKIQENSKYKNTIGSIKEHQIKKYGNYLKKLRSKNFNIICQGDSLTYGQDSEGSRTGMNGSSTKQSDTTYPEQLQNVLRYVNGSENINVVNWGYPGDRVDQGFTRFNVKPTTDIIVYMYGTNENSQNIPFETYIDNYIKLLYRNVVEWGIPAVIMSPLRNFHQEGLTNLHVYRALSKMLAESCGIPFIDGYEILVTATNDFFSTDTIHLREKGYKILGTKVAPVLLSNYDVPKIGQGKDLIIDKTYANIVSPFIISGSSNSGGGGFQPNLGWSNDIKTGRRLTFPVYCEEDFLVIIPVYNSGVSFKISIDIEQEQGNGMIPVSADVRSQQALFNSIIKKYINCPSGNYNDILNNNSVNVTTKDNYIVIPSRGLHLITVENETSTSCVISGLVVMSWSNFFLKKRYIGSKPDTGRWIKNDMFYNANVSSGSYMGWICLESGDFDNKETGLLADTTPYLGAINVDGTTGLSNGNRFNIDGIPTTFTATSGIYTLNGKNTINITPNMGNFTIQGAEITLADPIWKGFGMVE